jgi:putative redox protein
MATSTIKWLNGKTFVGTDSTKHSVVLSTPDEGVGIKPSELLMLALGACTAVDVVEILEKKRTPLTSLEIRVSGEQNSEPPWAFHSVHLKYILKGKGLQPKDVDQAIRLSEEKYCSVSATIRGVAKIDYEFEILPE